MQSATPSDECVILLHGLGRTASSMKAMNRALRKNGYHTVNIDYPSRSRSVAELAAQTLPQALRQCRNKKPRRIHFVTHSMGGILLRYYLKDHRPAELGRVVMLSPPNKGSEVVDKLRHLRIYQWANGPAGQELGTDGLPTRLGAVDYPVGIITGNKAAFWDLWFSILIEGEDDGKVSIDSARLEGMRDYLVLPYSHTFIMQRRDVIDQVLYFLRQGHFRHGDKDSAAPHTAS